MERISEQGVTRSDVTKSKGEKLQYIFEKMHSSEIMYSEDERQIKNYIYDVLAEEISEAVKYTNKLPSFANCNGHDGRVKYLRELAEFIVYEHLLLTEEQIQDFNKYLPIFKENVHKRIRFELAKLTQQAQRESIQVHVKHDRKTNENERCTIVANQKDITDEATNPNYLGESSFPGEENDTEKDLMDRRMGPYSAF